MPHFIVSYDLNGPNPTHEQVDEHFKTFAGEYGRILETVWYVRYSGDLSDFSQKVNSILSQNDRLMVVEIADMQWRNLLISSDSLKETLAKA